jgi:hypothetical protein
MTRQQTQTAVCRALHSLKEDAAHAWKEALGGNFEPLVNVGRSFKELERVIVEADLKGDNV